MPQIFQGDYFRPGVDPSAPDCNPMVEALNDMGVEPGMGGVDFAARIDALDRTRWTQRPAAPEAGEKTMTVQAIRDDLHGKLLLNIGWDRHLMFAAPICLPLPPELPFQALVREVLPGLYGQHPDFTRIDWAQVQWLRGGEPFSPEPARSLADNGLDHKAVLRLRTPGRGGLYGIGF